MPRSHDGVDLRPGDTVLAIETYGMLGLGCLYRVAEVWDAATELHPGIVAIEGGDSYAADRFSFVSRTFDEPRGLA